MRFFRPDAPRLILLTLFFLIALLGWHESSAFADGPAPRTSFWTLWMALLAPLGLVLLLVRQSGLNLDLFRASAPLFWIVQITYFYLLACAIVWLVSVVLRKRRSSSSSSGSSSSGGGGGGGW